MSTTLLHEVPGDLLQATEPVIVQQINCLCVRPHGLSAVITKKFPYANVYGQRRPKNPHQNLAIPEDQGQPGQITISYPPKSDNQPIHQPIHQPIVIGLYGQYDYGKPGTTARRSTLQQDNYVFRELWFTKSLKRLKQWLIEHQISSVAFPYGIGCGLAGGNWTRYCQILEQFAADAPYKVMIYRLP